MQKFFFSSTFKIETSQEYFDHTTKKKAPANLVYEFI